jgi:hypothetical protein
VSTLSPDRDLKARDFSIQLTAAPASFRTLGLWVNGALALFCTVASTSTPCTASGPVDVPANSTLSIYENHGVGASAADARFAFRLTNF